MLHPNGRFQIAKNRSLDHFLICMAIKFRQGAFFIHPLPEFLFQLVLVQNNLSIEITVFYNTRISVFYHFKNPLMICSSASASVSPSVISLMI